MKIEKWSKGREIDALAFLEKYKETSMFLLTNFIEHGPYQGNHQNSGNFYLVFKSNQICGVFCLPSRGNLLLQVEEHVELDLILDFLQKNEKIALKGVLGENSTSFEVWNRIKKLNARIFETLSSKEILYTIDLKSKEFVDSRNTRLFGLNEFDIYFEFIQNFNADLNLPIPIDTEKVKERFEYLVENKLLWALVADGEVASMAAINAKYKKLVQVGGVYTANKFRSQGFSKKCMNKLLHDCKYLYQRETVILFTGETNFPAQKVYESVGFNRIGHYGIYLGSIGENPT